jgi:hypothetical protein
MNTWQFFGNPSDCGDMVDVLRWRIAIGRAEASILERQLRDCELAHIAWMESQGQSTGARKVLTGGGRKHTFTGYVAPDHDS